MKSAKRKPGRRSRCPSCDYINKRGAPICDICGADLSRGGEVQPSFLNDTELAGKLKLASDHLVACRLGIAASVLLLLVGFAASAYALAIFAIISAAICVALSLSKASRLKTLVSANVVRGALSEIMKLESFSPGRHINSDTVKGTELIGHWNECTGSDFVKGKYRGSEISFSDITLTDVQRHTDSNGHTHETRTVRFKGQWLICRLGKNIAHPLRLRENRAKLFGKGYKKAKSTVETENVAFNEKFQIIADDPHTAFYILTPHFMEYINSADAVAQGKTYLCFAGNYVHFAVGNDRDLFEIKASPGKLRDIPALRARIRSEAALVTGIIDELMLNKYLFGKED